jgi:hypothetical protein
LFSKKGISLLVTLSFLVLVNSVKASNDFNFDFVAPSVYENSDAPNQVGLIIYNSNENAFFARGAGSGAAGWQQLATVADTGHIYVEYTGLSNSSFVHNTEAKILYNTEVKDTHNAAVYTPTSNWVFTAPREGVYSIKGMVAHTDGASILYAANNDAQVAAYVNNSLQKYCLFWTAAIAESVSTFHRFSYACDVYLNEGDQLDMRFTQDSGENATPITSASQAWLTISSQ